MWIIPEYNPQIEAPNLLNETPDSLKDGVSSSKIITYKGRAKSVLDALLLFEATRLEILPTVNRRLNGIEKEKYIKPNTIFVWNETQCGMKRWTDGKVWSPSKVHHGQFLIYKQLPSKDKKSHKETDSDSSTVGNTKQESLLIKQSFSIITNQNQKLHLISYYLYDPEDRNSKKRKRSLSKPEESENSMYSSSSDGENDNEIMIPSNDPSINHLTLSNTVYPEVLLSKERIKHLRKANDKLPIVLAYKDGIDFERRFPLSKTAAMKLNPQSILLLTQPNIKRSPSSSPAFNTDKGFSASISTELDNMVKRVVKSPGSSNQSKPNHHYKLPPPTQLTNSDISDSSRSIDLPLPPLPQSSRMNYNANDSLTLNVLDREF